MIDIIKAISEFYTAMPLSHRFVYAPWVVLFILYLFASEYDKLHMSEYYNKRKKVKNNYGWYIWVFVIAYYIVYIITYNYFGVDYRIFDESKSEIFIVGYIILWIGLFFWGWARASLDGQWGSAIYNYEEGSGAKLITHGAYNSCRHPLYFGHALMSLGTIIMVNSLLYMPSFLFVVIFAILRARNEEKYLEKVYDKEYLEYKRNVSAAIPWLHKINGP